LVFPAAVHRHLFERAFIQFVLEDPEAISSLGVFEQLGYKGFDGMLTDVSPAHERKLAQMAQRRPGNSAWL